MKVSENKVCPLISEERYCGENCAWFDDDKKTCALNLLVGMSSGIWTSLGDIANSSRVLTVRR